MVALLNLEAWDHFDLYHRNCRTVNWHGFELHSWGKTLYWTYLKNSGYNTRYNSIQLPVSVLYGHHGVVDLRNFSIKS